MNPKVGLALGGGAARGLAHLGVLKVLEEAKIPFQIITGTSLGALVGGLYASQPDAAYWMGRVEQFLSSFQSRRNRLEFIRKLEEVDDNCGFFTDMANLVRKSFFWGVTATKSAFISEKEYEEFLYPLIPDMAIEETKIPFGCVATDIRKAARVLYIRGSLEAGDHGQLCAARNISAGKRRGPAAGGRRMGGVFACPGSQGHGGPGRHRRRRVERNTEFHKRIRVGYYPPFGRRYQDLSE